MRLKWIRRAIAALGIAGLVSTFGPGCAQPDSELFIKGVMIPNPPPDCHYRAEADALLRGDGTIDVSFRGLSAIGGDYVAVLLIGNQLVTRGDPSLVRTETGRVTLKTADVTLTTTGGTLIQSYSVPISGFVDPARGGEPGYGFAPVTLLPGTLANSLSGDRSSHRVVANVRVFGSTLGGSDVQSDVFQYVIYTCWGCLISYPAAELTTNGECSSMSGGSSIVLGCIQGQDDPVDCGSCTATNPTCVAPGR